MPQGAATKGLQVGNLTTQTDIKSRWPDSSIRFAIVTANVPATGTYAITSAAPAAGALTPTLPSASVTMILGGVTYTATLPSTPATDIWLSGPLVSEARSVVAPVTSGGGSHPFLRVNFDTRMYSDRQGRIDVSVENMLDTTGATTVTYDVTIVVNGQAVLSKSAVQHFYLTRWRKVFEIASTRLATVTPDITPFNQASALPPYLSLVANLVSAPTGSSYDILREGALVANMSDQTDRPELAPFPDWTARYLVHRHPIQRSFVLANGDLSGSWPVHVRESDDSAMKGVGTERLISIDERPTLWYDARAQAGGLDYLKGAPLPLVEYAATAPGAGQTALIPDNAHQPSLAYVPYLLTGDRYYAEEMAFWANYGMLHTDPGDGIRGAQGILERNEVRGIGWALRNLADAAAFYPDASPVKAYLSQKLLNNLRWLDAYATARNAGTNPNTIMWTGLRPDGPQYIALWEQNDLAYALDRASKLGFTGGVAHRDAIARFQLKLFTSDPDYPRAQAAPSLVAVGTPTAGRLTFYQTLAEIWSGTAGNTRPFAGFYGPDARLSLMIGIERGWPGAQAAYDYLWPFLGVQPTWGTAPDLSERAGWALDFAPPDAATSAPTFSPAQMISPAAGSTLTSSGQTFTWTAGTGVSSYKLDVGTTVGGTTLYAGVAGLALSATVTGLPTDGRPFWVRISSRIDGTWQSTDYPYTAFKTKVATSPSSGIGTAPALTAASAVNVTSAESSTGGTIATVGLTAGWATFGEAVPQGQATSGLQIGSLATQTDVKNRWQDGSIKFAILSANIPGAGSYAVTAASLQSGTFPPVVPTASVALNVAGTVYTATLPSAPSVDGWLAGPLVQEWRNVIAPLAGSTPHPFLRVIFDTRAYNDGKAHISFTVENILNLTGATTTTYDVTIVANGQTVFTHTNVQHYYLTRWRKAFDINFTPSTVTPDLTPFNISRAIPAYNSVINLDSRVDAIGSNFDILQSGAVDQVMGAHGGRAELGPLPDWTARYLVKKNATQGRFVMANGDLAGSWPIHVREPENGPLSGLGSEHLMSVDQEPNAWLSAGGSGIKGSPMPMAEYGTGVPGPGQSPLGPSNAHVPDLAFVPYLLTGDRYYADEMAFWANHGVLATSGHGAQGLLTGNEVRGFGWVLRNMAEAAAYYPDSSPVKTYLAQKVVNNLNWLNSFAIGLKTPSNPLWIVYAWTPYDRPEGKQYFTHWENNYLAYGIDRAVKLGFAADNAYRDAANDLQLKFFTSEPDYPRFEGAPYAIPYGTLNGSTVTFFTTMAQFKPGALANHRDFAGYYGPEARLSIMEAMERGGSGAQAAYDYLWSFIGTGSSYCSTNGTSNVPFLACRAGFALDPYPSSGTPQPLPSPTATLTATPASITLGAASTLTWSTTNATTVSINQSIGTVVASGTQSVSPTATTTYTLTATNATGSVTATASVTLSAPDTTPPVISGVASSSLTASGATISFTTNELSYHQVEYGVSTAYGTLTALDTMLMTSHSQATSGLTAGTLYHYRVRATDASGNTATSGDFTFTTLATPPPSSLVVGTVVFADGTNAVSAGPFNTAAGDLVIAFATAAGPVAGGQSLTISGGSLTWTRVTRANGMPGVADIWQASSPTARSSISVTSTPSVATYTQSLTVVTFSGAAGVGASASVSGPSGAPSLSLTTTAAGSLLYAVGNDWDSAVARTLGANQSMTHQWTSTGSGDTYWVQNYNGPVANAGTVVQLNDTAPTADRWNFAAVEVVAASTGKTTPVIAWPTPAAISYGTALGGTQLNATTTVAGTFVYTPASGTVLGAGAGQTLSVMFTPTNTANYNAATATVAITVSKATPVVTWPTPAAIIVGTALGSTQLNATASVPGTWVYTPPAGTVLPAGAAQSLAVTFTPGDTANYTTATVSVLITVSAPSVTVSSTTATAGGTVMATVANGPGLPGDWVGLYDAAGNAVQWQYLNGTQVKPATGVTSATVTFMLPATPGTYQVRFFNAAYVLLATSGSITTTVPSVTLSATTGTAGGTVMAMVANGPGNAGDWVGLYNTSGTAMQWQYLNGTQVKPAVGVTSSTVTFSLPSTPGIYQVRLFNATYTLVATSASITTTAPSVTLGATTGVAGGTVTATIANGPGLPGDWVGLYDAAGTAVQWQYLNGTQVKPATGVTSATVTFMLPTGPGTYQARLFNAAYTLVATSGSITTTVPTVTLSATTGSAGGTVIATIANGPGLPGDWVGLYDAGGNVLQWRYLNGSQTLPAVGIVNAAVPFTLPATPGIYHARFFNAAYVLLATSGSITTTVPSVTLSAATGTVGGSVLATVTNGPGTPGDWVGLYDATGTVRQWQYLNGAQTLPATGIANATVTFTLPATGTYHVRLFNATYTLVATSTTVTVP